MSAIMKDLGSVSEVGGPGSTPVPGHTLGRPRWILRVVGLKEPGPSGCGSPLLRGWKYPYHSAAALPWWRLTRASQRVRAWWTSWQAGEWADDSCALNAAGGLHAGDSRRATGCDEAISPSLRKHLQTERSRSRQAKDGQTPSLGEPQKRGQTRKRKSMAWLVIAKSTVEDGGGEEPCRPQG